MPLVYDQAKTVGCTRVDFSYMFEKNTNLYLSVRVEFWGFSWKISVDLI